MSRTKLFLITLLPGLISFALGQESRSASPQVPEDAFTTRELVAWSNLQKPQPAPLPLPKEDRTPPQPGQTPDQQPKPPADPSIQQAPVPAKSFNGQPR